MELFTFQVKNLFILVKISNSIYQPFLQQYLRGERSNLIGLVHTISSPVDIHSLMDGIEQYITDEWYEDSDRCFMIVATNLPYLIIYCTEKYIRIKGEHFDQSTIWIKS